MASRRVHYVQAVRELLVSVDAEVVSHLVHLLNENPIQRGPFCSELSRLRNDLACVWEQLLEIVCLSEAEMQMQWTKKRKTAANAGTWMHSMFEHVLNGHDVLASPMDMELDIMLLIGSASSV